MRGVGSQMLTTLLSSMAEKAFVPARICAVYVSIYHHRICREILMALSKTSLKQKSEKELKA